ncbi:cytochrome P450 [Streptomyces fuscichromogenes]|uniref:cytochrome P450 n=1 Tax=Streptomyces fuscichromogenes TaxID=1324013 RepID=UPI0038061504
MPETDVYDVDDLNAPLLATDPYAFFGPLREADPVHWNPHRKAWMVTRYDDVTFITRNPEIFSSAPRMLKASEFYPPIDEEAWDLVDSVDPAYRGHLGLGLGDILVLSADRPDHLRMREALHEWFTPRNVRRWTDLLRTTVDTLIEARYDEHRMEFKNDFATRLPFLAIRIMLDLPESDALHIKATAERLTNPADGTAGAVAALHELAGYFGPLLDERGKNPGDDILSLIAAGERNGVYTRPQAISVAITVLLAGHETTLTLITNGLHAFIKNPDQWDLLRTDPDGLAHKAVEECLRMEPSLVLINRRATRDIELSGTVMHAGDDVYGVLAAANRDPHAFENPDRFDITRFPNRHVTFGGGIHHCLGAALARLETQTAFAALAKRFERFALAQPTIDYLPDVFVHHMHQPTELNVTW